MALDPDPLGVVVARRCCEGGVGGAKCRGRVRVVRCDLAVQPPHLMTLKSSSTGTKKEEEEQSRAAQQR